jgi:hypothetical protein
MVPIVLVQYQPECTTTAMQIEQTRFCDDAGRIYHPYLAQWTPNSSLLHLIRNLIQEFGKSPPVWPWLIAACCH